MTRVIELTACLALLPASLALAQVRPQTPPPPPPGVTPQPVGRPGDTAPPRTSAPSTPAPATSGTAPVRPQQAPASPATPAPSSAPPADTRAAAGSGTSLLPVEAVPTEEQLGVPIHPSAKFLRSYDAGQGQRYYLFGSNASFAELVLYYRTQLRTRGDLVYEEPPVHMFEVGRFREETMAFPPGVTVKDYTWGGGKGYLVPIPGANPSRYPTIIQIVPVVQAGR